MNTSPHHAPASSLFHFIKRKRHPPAPLPIVQILLNRIAHNAGQKNAKIFERLGIHSRTAYLIDPTDLSFALSLQLDEGNPRITAHRRWNLPPHDARISGTLPNLMKLIDGELDGDALFFSRTLTIAGNIEAVVVLRNALDNMEGNFFGDAAQACGVFRPLAQLVINKLRTIEHD